VETSSTQLGQVIDDTQMLNLPLNGRSYIDLLTIQAGVAPQTSSTGNISVNGQRGSSNSFLVNGGDVNESVNFGASIIPNLDSVAEFRLITNAFDAEYGRFSGAVMNAITKSGTNGIHGTAFDFLRNSDFDSRSFFKSFRRCSEEESNSATLPEDRPSETKYSGSPIIKARASIRGPRAV